MEPITIDYKGYTITTDKSLMKLQDIHQWLSTEAYWCKNIPLSAVQTAFDNSFCIGILKDGRQIGYGRFITDYAVFAYLADVYVEDEHRRIGLSKKMMEILMNLDWMAGLRVIKLGTLDAHGLYEQYGFKRSSSGRDMEIIRANVYGDMNNPCT